MKTKRLFIALIIVAMIVMTLTGCSQKASKYTEEQHMQRISERIQKKYIDGDGKIRDYEAPKDAINAFMKPSGFEVYPLYDNNDELKYCLVEFQPYGFMYILIRDEESKIYSWFGASTSMYLCSYPEGDPLWTPCKIDKETGETIWEEESGRKKEYYHSPYYVRNVLEERKYVITCYFGEYEKVSIPAIKKDEKYINLCSNEEFEVVDGWVAEKPAVSCGISFIGKKHFDI